MPTDEYAGDDWIDPEVAHFVRAIFAGSSEYPDLLNSSFAEQRAAAEAVRQPWRVGGPLMHRVRDLIASDDQNSVRIRVYEPEASTGSPRPALIYIHGGGFTLFSLDTHDRLMREYAARAGVVVVGVDYSLSPEVRFPTALYEICTVVNWLHREAAPLAIDARRVAIGGDSAGANLAVSTCLVLRNCGEARISAMLLNYGFFDDDFATPSQLMHGEPGKFLTRDELAAYLDNYLGDAPRNDPLALPSLASLHDLPPSLHIIADCDPLADGDLAMVERMLAAGNRVASHVYAGATHSFLEAVSVSSLADRALADSAHWLIGTLAPEAVLDNEGDR